MILRVYCENGVVMEFPVTEGSERSLMVRQMISKRVRLEECSADVYIKNGRSGDFSEYEFLYTIISQRGRCMNPLYHCKELKYQ